MSQRQRLEALLAGAGEGVLIQRCCIALEYPSTLCRIGAGMTVEQARYVYQTRGQINQARGNPIDGYAELLPALDALEADTVHLHMVVTPREWFLVFTDAVLTQVIGILAARTGEVYEYFQRHPGEMDD